MEYSSTPELLVELNQFGDDLKTLAGAVDLPRGDVLRFLHALQNSFAALQSQIASGLEVRDRLLGRIDDAADEISRLAAQVKAMDGEIRALEARVDQHENSTDPYAGRH